MRPWKPTATMGLVAALGGMMLAAAVAQTPAPSRDPNMPDPKTVPPEKIAPPLTTGSIGQTLSDKLGKSDGVITPPSSGDADMRVKPPVPNPDKMPVLPPPGRSPTDPIQPK
jgi:hypothetical protein